MISGLLLILGGFYKLAGPFGGCPCNNIIRPYYLGSFLDSSSYWPEKHPTGMLVAVSQAVPDPKTKPEESFTEAPWGSMGEV